MDRTDILKLAHLARLHIDDQQVDAVAHRMNDALALIDQLQAADTDGVIPMAHPLDAVQRLRDDQPTTDLPREDFQAIAPATERGLYLVPKVID